MSSSTSTTTGLQKLLNDDSKSYIDIWTEGISAAIFTTTENQRRHIEQKVKESKDVEFFIQWSINKRIIPEPEDFALCVLSLSDINRKEELAYAFFQVYNTWNHTAGLELEELITGDLFQKKLLINSYMTTLKLKSSPFKCLALKLKARLLPK